MVRKWQEAQDILVILALTWYSCEGFVSRLLKKVRKLVSLFITPYSATDLKDTYEEYVCVQYICLRVPLTHKQLTGFHTHRQFTMETHYFIYFLGTEASQARLPNIFFGNLKQSLDLWAPHVSLLYPRYSPPRTKNQG